MSLSYTDAIRISSALRATPTYRKALRLLQAKSREIGRSITFTIVRFGDPRKWNGVMPRGKRSIVAATVGKRRFKSLAARDAYLKSPFGKRRSCVLQRLDNGRIIRAKSIVAFCKRTKLGGNAQYHINPVLDGQRGSYKGWYLPETLAAPIALTDVYGNEKTLPFVSWVKEQGFSPRTLFGLLTERKTQLGVRRVALSSAPFKAIIQPRADHTVSVTIQRRGERPIKATNLNQAAQKVGMFPTELYRAAYGLRADADGYRVKEVITERRSAFSA